MGQVAWLVTHLPIVLLLLASRVATHEGVNLSQWVARMLFSLVGCLVKKPLPKAVLMAKKICRPFCKLVWSASWASYSHLLSRQPVAPSSALRGLVGA